MVKSFTLPLGVSARHCHVTREHLDILFGKGFEMHIKKPISQVGQYAAEEQVMMIAPNGKQMKLRILGPCRSYTQIELSATDARSVGMTPPMRHSGDVKGSAPCTLVGPNGKVELTEGVVLMQRHIHLCEESAKLYGVNDGDMVEIECPGPRGLTFKEVYSRCGKGNTDEVHIDTDEGNACGLNTGEILTINKLNV